MTTKHLATGIAGLVLSLAAAAATTPVQMPPELESLYKAAAAKGMLDPGSAQFRNVRFFLMSEGKPASMCAEVNAKNAYGGYVGFRPIAVLGDAELTVVSPDFASILCRDK